MKLFAANLQNFLVPSLKLQPVLLEVERARPIYGIIVVLALT